MNLEQRLKLQLGELLFTINHLHTELEQVKTELEQLKKEKDER